MHRGVLTLTLALLAPLAGAPSAVAQGTAFTYQGRLDKGGTPVADGTHDLQFTVHDTATVGTGNAIGTHQPRPRPVASPERWRAT